MSVEVVYARVSPEVLDEMQKAPKSAEPILRPNLVLPIQAQVEELRKDYGSYLNEGDVSHSRMNIHKDWQALHFVLTGEVIRSKKRREESPVLWKVVGGGKVSNFRVGSGKVRFLTPDEVGEVSHTLQNTAIEALPRLRPEAFKSCDIYAYSGDSTQDDMDGLRQTYQRICRFFKAAAQQGQVVLMWSE